MKKHELLAEPERLSRRTAMDALEILRQEATSWVKSGQTARTTL